ncbi:hypothetical protein LguiB_024030 [Lonicera macranthoides]
MAKKNWFNLLKRFFNSNKEKEKEKRRRWVFGKRKIRQLAPLSAQPSSRETLQSEAEEQRSLDGAEFAQLTSTPRSTDQSEEENRAISAVEIRPDAPRRHLRKNEDVAATKIQTAFRGYLARKALRALKALVRLQAIIRGRAVRKQAITTLKQLQSIVNIQSQVCARRCEMADRSFHCHESKEYLDFRGKDIKIDSNSQRRWDDSILTKEEEYALFSSKREAAIKRERIKEYAFNHRRSTETEQNSANGRWKYWLDKWVDTRLTIRKDLQKQERIFSSEPRNKEEMAEKKPKSRNIQRQYLIEGLNSPIKGPRRSFHRKQHSIGDDTSLRGSPIVPTYMAATESARAKSRSLSSPRLRPMGLDYYSDSNSPYKYKLTPISPINSRRIGNPSSVYSQKSPSLKEYPGPVKSNGPLKDLSIDSLFSLQNWETALR